MANFTIGEMRRIITKVYPGESWKNRVKRMYDGQVVAIFYSFMENGKIDRFGRPIVKKSCGLVCTESTGSGEWVRTTGEQLSFW